MATKDDRSRVEGGQAVLIVWQELTGIILTAKERRAFLAKPEVDRLASERITDLVAAAPEVRSSEGLQLSAWLAAVCRRADSNVSLGRSDSPDRWATPTASP